MGIYVSGAPGGVFRGNESKIYDYVSNQAYRVIDHMPYNPSQLTVIQVDPEVKVSQSTYSGDDPSDVR
jgi:hypothetical protein